MSSGLSGNFLKKSSRLKPYQLKMLAYFACRDVPLSLLISLSAVVLGYVAVSSALTLMIPYNQINIASPFSSAFHARGLEWAKYVISVGALAGMTAALLSALLVVPRYLYAMARDGLLMNFFENVNKTTKVS